MDDTEQIESHSPIVASALRMASVISPPGAKLKEGLVITFLLERKYISPK
jgi:hypothetical protein